jgi:hypothetical protein
MAQISFQSGTVRRWSQGENGLGARPMYILTITYPKSADATFDFDYFRSKHLPEVGKAFKPFGRGASRRGKPWRRGSGLFRNHDR